MRYVVIIFIFLLNQLTFGQKDSTAVNQLLDQAYTLESTQPYETLKLYHLAFQKSLKTKYNIGTTKALQYSGIVHSDLANYDSAIYYYKKALPYSVEANYRRGSGGLYINLGNAYQYKGEFNNVIDNYIKGIKIFEEIKDSSRLGMSYENLASFYSSLKNHDKEIEYLTKALHIIPNNDDERLSYAFGDLGLAYLSTNQTEKAFANFKKADSISKRLDDNRLTFFAQRNFGEYYSSKKQFDKAIPYFENALTNINQVNDAYYKNDVLLQLGQTYSEVNEYAKAIHFLEEAVSLSKTNNALEIEQKAHWSLSNIYGILQKPEKAYQELKISTQLKDSLLNESHLKQINLLEKQYASEKKDKELAKKQIDLEHNQLELSKKQNEITLATIGSILLLLSILGLWYVFRQRQKLKNIEISKLKQQQDITKLQALIEGEEKERNRLAQELHDGINGDLSSIKYQLSSVKTDDFSAESKSIFEKTIAMIDFSCQQVRNISHNLSPMTIRDFGLITSIKNYCSKLESIHPIAINFQHFGNEISLPKSIETVIYRIVQELVNNIIKHADATNALVQINTHDDTMFITVEDNGKGFKNDSKNSGIGLKNIASRIAFLNANFEEEHNKNGTTFTIHIDLKNIPTT